MFSMLRMLLRTSYPIERPSSGLGRKVGIYHLPWIGLKKQSFLSNAGLSLYLMAMACRAQPLFFSGFASIPRWLTMKPRNFSANTPKAHLAGFSFML